MTARCRAQQPDVRPYQTEEDLWEALREGEITREEYLRLLETYRVGTDSTFLPLSDWEELPGSDAGYLSAPDTANTITRMEEPRAGKRHRVRWWWRNGYDGRLSSASGSDGYFTGRISGPGWRALFNWRQDDRSGDWQRRVVEYRLRGVIVQAGNVEPRWGRGLVVGRRSRVIGSTTSEAHRTDGGFWQPGLSRFNGLRLVTGTKRAVSADWLVSDIRSDNLAERMTAMLLRIGRSSIRAGLTALAGSIRRRSGLQDAENTSGCFVQRVFGGHVRLGRTKRALLAEIAVARGGATAKAAEAVWRFERGQFHGRAWSYSPEFVNPWGGGPADNDRRSIMIDEIGTSYSSRTIGERGFSLATRIDPQPVRFGGRLSADWEWMTHRSAPGDPLEHRWTARLTWRRKRMIFRPYVLGAAEEGTRGRHALGWYGSLGDTDRRLSTRLEYGRQRGRADRYIRAGMGTQWRLNHHVRLEPAVRWVDPDLRRPADGYWYFYFTEVIFPTPAWRVEAALVWQRYEDHQRGDIIELRLRTVAGWM